MTQETGNQVENCKKYPKFLPKYAETVNDKV